MKYLVISESVKLKRRIPVNDENYPGMTPEQARDAELGVDLDERINAFIDDVQDANFKEDATTGEGTVGHHSLVITVYDDGSRE